MAARWAETSWQDVRYALRAFRVRPAFTLAAAGTLALGIGANTAIFSIVSGVMLRPLPFRDPDRLVRVSQSQGAEIYGALAIADLQEFRTVPAIESLLTYGLTSRNLEGVEDPEQLSTSTVERGVLRLLGSEPAAGRVFRDDDSANVAVISSALARRRFGEARAAIDRSIRLDGDLFTVIGVMPDGFQFPYGAVVDLWVPAVPPPQARRADSAIARLRPGVTIQTAQSQMELLAKRFAQEYPHTDRGRDVHVTSLHRAAIGKARESLLVLLGAVGLVLLVACANVANLLLARAAERVREVAIRAALGAGRGRLMRQFLSESLLLAAAGGVLGLALGRGGAWLLLRLAATEIPRSQEIGFDWRVFAFLLAISAATGLGFGFAPAMAAARSATGGGLARAAGRTSLAAGKLRDGLVVAEVALAFLLLIGSGLLLRAFLNLVGTPTGFSPDKVLTIHLTVPPGERRSSAIAGRYCDAIEEKVRQIPGVRDAGFISYLPLERWGWSGHFNIEGHPAQPPELQPLAELRYTGAGYFRALGIPLKSGRAFSERDTAETPRVILINEALARQHFPNEDPVGRKLDRGLIIGVVGDVRSSGLDRPAAPEIYYALRQNFAQLSAAGMTLVVSTHGAPEDVAGAVRAAVRSINPNQPVFRIRTMERVIADSLANLKLYLWLIGLFATLALALAAAGIYAVISYAVTARTQEFGIRMALGADGPGLLRLVLGHGAMLTALGLVLGLGGAIALTRLLGTLLFGVTPTDPATFALAAAVLLPVALAACGIPARRASQVDPATALRRE